MLAIFCAKKIIYRRQKKLHRKKTVCNSYRACWKTFCNSASWTEAGSTACSDTLKTNLQPQKTDCCKTENAENELQEQRIQKTILTEPHNRMHKHHAMISLLNWYLKEITCRNCFVNNEAANSLTRWWKQESKRLQLTKQSKKRFAQSKEQIAEQIMEQIASSTYSSNILHPWKKNLP